MADALVRVEKKPSRPSLENGPQRQNQTQRSTVQPVKDIRLDAITIGLSTILVSGASWTIVNRNGSSNNALSVRFIYV